MTVIEIEHPQYAQAHLVEAGVRAVFILADSKMVGREWQTPLDFLIVDGDHSYDGVRADLAAWMPHLKPGASVFVHDCYPTPYLDPSPGVRRAVDEFMPGEPLRVGTAAVFTRTS